MLAIRWLFAVAAAALVAATTVLDPIETHAQTAPLFETRAVWFATVLGDGGWPESTSTPAAEQEAHLRERIATARANGINTFIFQAVGRGDAMYRSERLPWSARLRSPGEDPGYDPLAVAVDEAHKLGMELHAWINVFRVGDTSTLEKYQGVSDPAHVGYAQPEWVRDRDGQLWIDPSNEEARAWLVGNVMEIVENYDVDAVHFDFIRYPTGGFGDDLQTCRDASGGTCADVHEWRREQVNAFAKAASDAVLQAKPWVKVGATPVGHYHDDYPWAHLSGFHDVYQDSRGWAASGHVDYLAPQVYWGIGGAGGSPRYEVLAEEWVDETPRPVFVGIAAYTPSFSADELDDQVEIARSAGAAGHVFFRYDHFLANIHHIREAFPAPALAAQMTHRFEFHQPPSTPENLSIRRVGSSTVELTWEAATGAETNPVHGYAVFRSEGREPDPSAAADLFRVVGATQFSEGFSDPPTSDVYYRVVAVSKLGEVSDGSNVVSTAALDLEAGGERPGGTFRIHSIYPNPTSGDAALVFELDRGAHVQVSVYDALGRRVALSHDGPLPSGRHEIRLDIRSVSPGAYFVEVRTEDGRVTRQVVRL